MVEGFVAEEQVFLFYRELEDLVLGVVFDHERKDAELVFPRRVGAVGDDARRPAPPPERRHDVGVVLRDEVGFSEVVARDHADIQEAGAGRHF